jgi:peptidoglycan/xylan/chitin deacetylase (PgdA/CDA1 family)
MIAQPPVPILMYHEVVAPEDLEDMARKTQRGYLLRREDFARQLQMLRESGFESIDLEQLAAGAQGGHWPARPIVLSFDDGYAGNYRHAFPLLREAGFQATFFVVSNKIGQDAMMSWTQLSEMARAGMAVESHTANHPLLSTLDAPATRAELADSRKAIEDHLGRPVRFLSLPNGDSNPHYPALAAECGYLGGCSSQFGYNRPGTDRWFWQRIAVRIDTSPARLRRLATAAPLEVALQTARAAAKGAVARALGKARYDRLYIRFFDLEEQDERKRP